jgi:hypothetical protein
VIERRQRAAQSGCKRRARAVAIDNERALRPLADTCPDPFAENARPRPGPSRSSRTKPASGVAAPAGPAASARATAERLRPVTPGGRGWGSALRRLDPPHGTGCRPSQLCPPPAASRPGTGEALCPHGRWACAERSVGSVQAYPGRLGNGDQRTRHASRGNGGADSYPVQRGLDHVPPEPSGRSDDATRYDGIGTGVGVIGVCVASPGGSSPPWSSRNGGY